MATYEEKMTQGYKNLTGISRREADERNKEAKKHKKGTAQIYRENREYRETKESDKKYKAWMKLQKTSVKSEAIPKVYNRPGFMEYDEKTMKKLKKMYSGSKKVKL